MNSLLCRFHLTFDWRLDLNWTFYEFNGMLISSKEILQGISADFN